VQLQAPDDYHTVILLKMCKNAEFSSVSRLIKDAFLLT